MWHDFLPASYKVMRILDVVIPCFNESENFSHLVRECKEVTSASDGKIGFILVNNGSTDIPNLSYFKMVEGEESINYINLETNQGYGGGILAGLGLSKAQFIGWTHADFQIPLNHLLDFLPLLESDAVFIKGHRKRRKFRDKFFSVNMSIFETLLFGKLLTEINAQPTVMSREVYALWKNPPLDFSLDLFAMVTARYGKTRIRRLPVHYLDRRFGNSSWNTGLISKIRFSKRTIKYSLKLRAQILGK